MECADDCFLAAAAATIVSGPILPVANQDSFSPETASPIAALSVDDALEHLATSREGLIAAEATARLRRFGRNSLPRPRRSYWFAEMGRQFFHLIAILLWTAALLAWWVGMPELSVAVVIVIVINGLFSYWQQFRAEKAVEALESLLPRHATVRRSGEETTLSADEVALGDVLILSEGNAIPADARVITCQRLRVDMSSLTGESRPVGRNSDPCRVLSGSAAELWNVVLAGTFVSSGRAEAVVFATGSHTEFGRLAALTHAQPSQPSPLQKQMTRITRVITLLAIGVSRQAKPASHRQVKTSHFEKGNIRRTGLLAAQPQKEAGDGECSQDGDYRVDTVVTCAALVAAADRS